MLERQRDHDTLPRCSAADERLPERPRLFPDRAARRQGSAKAFMTLWLELLAEQPLLTALLETAARLEPPYREILERAAADVGAGEPLYRTLDRYRAFVDESFIHACWVGEETGNLTDALEWADREAFFYDPANPRSELCHVGGLLELWQRVGLTGVGLTDDPVLRPSALAHELAAESRARGRSVEELVRERLIASLERKP